MKRRLKIIGGTACALAILFLIWCKSGSIYPRLLLGKARVLTNQVRITVDVNDQELDGFSCFAEPGMFRHPSERLILWMDAPHSVLGYRVLIVDLAGRRVLVPNLGPQYYGKVLRGRWLIQSDAGTWGVPFGDSKLDGRDPDFQRLGDTISFTILPVLDLPSGRWKLRIGASG